jgi:hypothetical protein
VQRPAVRLLAELAEDPLARMLGQHETAVLQLAVGLDEDDLALQELGLHAGAEHAQGKGFAT